MRGDRLDLLRRLTDSSERWTLVKSARSALDGSGDVDSAAPADDWPLILSTVAAWAADTARGPVVACDHVPGMLVLAAVEPGSPPRLVQVDVVAHRLLRGLPVIDADDLLRGAALAPEGYRALTPGAEGVARLVLDEWRSLARPPAHAARNELTELLRGDRLGADAVASVLGTLVGRAVRRLAGGRWPRAALVLVELRNLAAAVARPRTLAARIVEGRSARACPLLGALAAERTVRGDLDAWLEAVRRAHPGRESTGR